MSNIFEAVAWDGTSYKMCNPYTLDATNLKTQTEIAISVIKTYLKGATSIAQSFIVPYFVALGTERLVTNIIENKQDFGELTVEDMSMLALPFSQVLSGFICELQEKERIQIVNKSLSVTELLKAEDDYLQELMGKYSESSYGAVAYLFLSSEVIPDYVKKVFAIGMCIYLSDTNQSDKLPLYMGLNVSDKPMTMGEIISDTYLMATFKNLFNLPQDFYLTDGVTAQAFLNYIERN